MSSNPRVAVIMGSQGDWEVMQTAVKMLKDFGVSCEAKVMSAHRTPELVAEYVRAAPTLAYEYIVNAGASYALTYPAAALEQSKATLTHRGHLNDTPQVVPASGWQYDASGTAISLLPAGTSFVPNDIYELSYTAKNPTVNGGMVL